MLTAGAAREIDEAMLYVLDSERNTLHGPDGGPFPFSSKAAAASVAARWNRKEKRGRRFKVVTWVTGREVH